MTPQGHLVRMLNMEWIMVLAALLALSVPTAVVTAEPADSVAGELFSDTDSDSEAKESATQPRTELVPGEKVEMTQEGNFDLSVQGADLRMVLRQLSRQARKNIIVSKSVEGTANVDLYGVTMQEALEAILKSNDLVSVEEGSFIYVYTAKEFADLRKMEYRVFKLYYIRADDAKKLVMDVLSPNGKVSTTPPPEEGIIDAPMEVKDWGGAQDHASEAILVVFDYPEQLEKVAEIIKEIDAKPDQVLIEATILSANLDETNALGIDLQVLAGVDFQTFGVTSDLTGITVPAPPAGGVKNFNQAQGRVVTPFTNNFPAGSSPMSVGFINNNVGVFLKALEGITDTTVLANPKLLVVNKQRGDVLVGNMDGYITTTVSQTVATETVEFLETGTKLRVRPFIGKDGYIRMELHPEISRGKVEQVTEGGPALPSKQTTEVTLNVLVRDGKTIVIAGLFRDEVIIQRNQTPVLGNVPVVGQLFRSTVDTTVREEVIILLTPHIIQQEAAELASERVRDDMERTRVGVRKGLQWFSRSKLADTYARWARRDARNGDMDKAMWNLDLALSLEPKMIDAIRLKERLTHKAYWADQPAFMSTRNIIKRMMMQELGKPFEEVTYPTKPLDANKLDPIVRETFGIENDVVLPLDWPRPDPAKVEHMGEVKTLEVQTESFVEPAAPIDRTVEIPAPTPMVEEDFEEQAETVDIEPMVEPAPEPLKIEAETAPLQETPKIEPVKEPAEKKSEIKPQQPAPKPQAVDVEPDFGSEVIEGLKESSQPQSPKVSQAKPVNPKQTNQRKLHRSLVEELQQKSKKDFQAQPSADQESATPTSQSSTTLVQPGRQKDINTVRPADRPEPIAIPAKKRTSWTEPRPLSEALEIMASK